MSTTDTKDENMRYGNQESSMDTKPDKSTAGVQGPELYSTTLKSYERMISDERQRISDLGEVGSELLGSLQVMYDTEKQKLEEQYQDRKGHADKKHVLEEGEIHDKNDGKDGSVDDLLAKGNPHTKQHATRGTSFAGFETGVKARGFDELVEYLNALFIRGLGKTADDIYTMAVSVAHRAREDSLSGKGEMKSGSVAQLAQSTMIDTKTAREAELERLLQAALAENKILKEFELQLRAKEAENLILKESLAAVLAPVDRAASVRAAPFDPPLATRSASYQAIMSPRYAAPHPSTSSSWRDRSGSLDPQLSTYTSQEQLQANSSSSSGPEHKVYCTYWIRRGECDYAAVGCKYRHEMPQDRETLRSLGFRDVPRWYLDWEDEMYRREQATKDKRVQDGSH